MRKSENIIQRKIIANYIQAYNNFDVGQMIQDLDQNIVFENISNGHLDLRTEGLEAFKKQAESAKHYFTQRKQTISSWNFDDPKVIVTIDYEAILAIDLPNGMKAGDTFKLKGKSTFEFDGDMVVKIIDES